MAALFYCWHRPGKLLPMRNIRLCRYCSVPVEECPCVSYGRTPQSDCPACEESGWVGIIRSKADGIEQNLGLRCYFDPIPRKRPTETVDAHRDKIVF